MEGKQFKTKKADSKVQNLEELKELSEKMQNVMEMGKNDEADKELVRNSEQELKSKRKSLKVSEEKAKVHELKLKAIKDSIRNTRAVLEREKMFNKRHLEETKTLIKEKFENIECSTQTDEQDLEAEKGFKFKEANEKQERNPYTGISRYE